MSFQHEGETMTLQEGNNATLNVHISGNLKPTIDKPILLVLKATEAIHTTPNSNQLTEIQQQRLDEVLHQEIFQEPKQLPPKGRYAKLM